ncbi:hypothetical protein CROQUDRAFT_698886 [Cronartium quercuum f. sp. fusiforme G11]|uniref:Uncharacterized protein n=1 Tax=Cronartium quercuum f. sp. fusiforme G11 TaxID=708437 RepID=A0A9P6TCK0_9BASI|nr:hypothetical protein CROQUDRAFT_698886 [Cronartium quercuum f. sp. fusiforme G11]
MATDHQRMTLFYKIHDFWAQMFLSLSLSVFKANQNLAKKKKAKVPGFDPLDC